jgi:hypothetical protein
MIMDTILVVLVVLLCLGVMAIPVIAFFDMEKK